MVGGVHKMLLPQKQMLLLKYPNELGCKNKHVTNDGWICLLLNVFDWELFLLYPDEPIM